MGKTALGAGGGVADSAQLHETSVLSNLEEQLMKSQVRKVLLSCRLATPGRKPIICIDEAQVCKAWKSTKKTEFFGNNSQIIPLFGQNPSEQHLSFHGFSLMHT